MKIFNKCTFIEKEEYSYYVGYTNNLQILIYLCGNSNKLKYFAINVFSHIDEHILNLAFDSNSTEEFSFKNLIPFVLSEKINEILGIQKFNESNSYLLNGNPFFFFYNSDKKVCNLLHISNNEYKFQNNNGFLLNNPHDTLSKNFLVSNVIDFGYAIGHNYIIIPNIPSVDTLNFIATQAFFESHKLIIYNSLNDYFLALNYAIGIYMILNKCHLHIDRISKFKARIYSFTTDEKTDSLFTEIKRTTNKNGKLSSIDIDSSHNSFIEIYLCSSSIDALLKCLCLPFSIEFINK